MEFPIIDITSYPIYQHDWMIGEGFGAMPLENLTI